MDRPFYKLRETATLQVSNPLRTDPRQPLAEAVGGNIRLGNMRAIYPMIQAINSDRLTRNYTFYTAKAMLGESSALEPHGYPSFVLPHGKPILSEHRSSDAYVPADIPMGRVVYSGYKKRGRNESFTPRGEGMPGTMEGTGYMVLIPAITEEQAIERILSDVYHTVSIGTTAESIIESITGKDLLQLYRDGNASWEDFAGIPSRGLWYEDENGVNRLSFWSINKFYGDECSYVNCPADTQAKNLVKDIGEEGIRLLLAEKVTGTKEFKFWDAVTNEYVEIDEGMFDRTYSLVDSYKPQTYWNMDTKPAEGANAFAALKESYLQLIPADADADAVKALKEKDVWTIDDLAEAGRLAGVPAKAAETESTEAADTTETIDTTLEDLIDEVLADER